MAAARHTDVAAVEVEVVFAGETLAGVVVRAGRSYDGYHVTCEAGDFGTVARLQHEHDPAREYAVRVTAAGEPVSCTCPAARFFPGRVCRHRAAVAVLIDLGRLPAAE